MGDELNTPIGVADEEPETLDDEPKNVLFAMIRQLKIGMDLHRITFPTFVLEPRSMLERITDFLAHQDLVTSLPYEQDPVARFVTVVKYFMSGWHIKPRGVKKPYNPVLGEYFRCKWNVDGSTAFYLAEQVSHHPPISAYYFANPDKGIFTQGYLAPKSRFLGNSSAAIMNGRSFLTFTGLPNEVYVITMPNIYAVGLFIGTMTYEIADSCTVTCEKNGLVAEIDFKFKPTFGGSHNNIEGKIKHHGETIYKLSGKWSDQMYIQECKNKKEKELYLDATALRTVPKIVTPVDEQGDYESRRLWLKVSQAIIKRNLDLATDEKTRIEDYQRKIRQDREEKDEEWQANFFRLDENETDWVFNYHKPGITTAELEQIMSEVVPRQAIESLAPLPLEKTDSLNSFTSSASRQS